MSLSRQRFFRKDFSGQNLSKQDLSYSEFVCCNFTNTDLSHANCTHSDFTGSILRNTKCTFTDFSHSALGCSFFPSDCFGMTLTLSCRTFKGMHISRMWWFGFIYFALKMKPELENGKDLRDNVIEAIGIERYKKLSSLFASREI